MDFVLYEKKENVAWITINRPDTLNAISSEVMRELLECLDKAQKDRDVLCAVLTGSGEKAFSAGGDVNEERKAARAEGAAFSAMGQGVCQKIQKLRVPVIAAVNGYALGAGMEFAIACDIVVAVETAKFGLPSVKLGIISAFGGTQNLTRIVGKARSKEIMFTGRMIKAQEAFELGIAQKVVAKELFISTVESLAKEIASMPPYAIRTIKEVVEVGIDMNLDTAYKIENEYAAPCYDTEDKYEAMTAFLEKRKPEKFINR